ncbi:hypothetical protein TrLO_g13958 [Triparma laevis f. longispina]|uniref:Uncharacterized protein n=1 Tax=Triparma laevis f. longispina TaxID=1714387 RepID=A0A9W7CEQ9_9STRA|nr:hypothetical protein TrLO_g13958 [Triparma laevis f. longispina]
MIADESSATKVANRAFRRTSINAGIETSLIPSPTQASQSTLQGLSDQQVRTNEQDMILFVQGSKNIRF